MIDHCMVLVIRSLKSNDARISFSIQKLKKQERIHCYTRKRTKQHAMKQKQFGPLDIVITRRKIQMHTVKKWRGGQSRSIGKRLILAN